ncbi:hypothetical protein GCM10007940_32290 [Portibacter lacus]|uniref:GSCFA domain-containing protein n=1 Tax=Portibacter lacus TaxID=1099794 RepID=A0AA37WF92_9BACT|nr:hypothetical protein GCM10007940_32290 [Portibacter lacus]
MNPCGITYNPISIANSIYYTIGMTDIKREDIQENNGIYFHFDFHSQFSGTSKDEVFEKITHHLEQARKFNDPDVLILSLGSAFTYFQSMTNEAVNNCHKIPQSSFEKVRLSISQISNMLNVAISEIRKAKPKMKVIVTVSPVRHLKDGMINNNLSKSSLLLSVPELEEATYFPSYELLLDDLRDYRFYDRDLVHPSSEAVDYILDFFEGQFFSGEKEIRDKVVKVQNDLKHRAFFPDSDQHQQFLKKVMINMQTLMEESNVDFLREIQATKEKLI